MKAQKTERIDHFRRVTRAYSDRSILMHEAIARKAGLSHTDHKYLGILVDAGEMPAGEWAARTGLTTGAITGLIDRLEKKGLVKRQFGKDDRRKVMIVPVQEQITALMQPLFADLQKRTLGLISSFTATELDTIERYFADATAIMEETTVALNQPQ